MYRKVEGSIAIVVNGRSVSAVVQEQQSNLIDAIDILKYRALSNTIGRITFSLLKRPCKVTELKSGKVRQVAFGCVFAVFISAVMTLSR